MGKQSDKPKTGSSNSQHRCSESLQLSMVEDMCALMSGKEVTRESLLIAEVRAKVLSVIPEKGRLRLGLKPSYFVDEEDSEVEEGENKAAVEEEAERSDLEDVLDTADMDSDDGADWRNAAAGDEEEQGKHNHAALTATGTQSGSRPNFELMWNAETLPR